MKKKRVETRGNNPENNFKIFPFSALLDMFWVVLIEMKLFKENSAVIIQMYI